MAFTTEFVMGAGGSVEMFEPAFTPNSSKSRATLATQSVGEGQWLVAVDLIKATYNAPQLWINGVQTTGGTSSTDPASTTAVVSGPGTITVEGAYVGSGNVYIVRIG